MESLTQWLLEFARDADNPLGLLILGASALVEYVFPPFPGDTITLFGAVLITANGWSFPLVFGATMLGSVAGAMLAFFFGQRLRLWRRRRNASPGEALDSPEGGTLDRLVEQFRRHGAAYLVINRFLPGIRSLFFVAAGLAEMRPAAVLLYSAISAALWNLAIIGVGALLGASFETLLEWFGRYTAAVWALIGAVILVALARALLRRRRAGGPPGRG